MSIIKGQNLRISVNGKYIAAATSCSIHIAANLESTSTKDSTGYWDEQECTGKSWDASVDAFVIVDSSDTGGIKAFDIPALIGTKVAVEVDITSGEQNRVKTTGMYTGYAIVNDINFTAANKSNSTATFQLQGVGELAAVSES